MGQYYESISFVQYVRKAVLLHLSVLERRWNWSKGCGKIVDEKSMQVLVGACELRLQAVMINYESSSTTLWQMLPGVFLCVLKLFMHLSRARIEVGMISDNVNDPKQSKVWLVVTVQCVLILMSSGNWLAEIRLTLLLLSKAKWSLSWLFFLGNWFSDYSR